MIEGLLRLDEGPLADAVHACRRHFAFLLFFSALLNILYIAPSIYMLQVYDRVMVSGSTLTLLFLTVVLVASLAALGLLDAVRGRLLAALSQRLDRLLTPPLLRAAMNERGSGSGARSQSQALRDFDVFRGAIAGAPFLAACDLPWAPLFILVCFLIHPLIGAVVATGGALLVLIAILGERRLRGAIKRQSDAMTSYAVIESDAQGAEAARAMGIGEALVDRQLEARRSLTSAQVEAANAAVGYSSLTRFLRLFLQSGVLGLGAYLAVERQISSGAIVAGSIIASRAFAPLEQIVGAWRQLGQGLQALASVRTALKEGAAVAAQRTALPAPRGALLLEGVAARLPGMQMPALRDINLRCEPGEIVGVLGPSGAGKTTLTRVMCGVLAPLQGVVRLDGSNLRDWDEAALGRHVGYLPQDNALFAGTVTQNVSRFDRPDATGARDAAVMEAAQAAGADQMIKHLIQGYNTPLGPGGRGLSAGQAQRIALARALYGSPALIVLDEPNAHLDPEGEAALIEALKRARDRGAVVVIAAHRTGFLGVVDKLVVLRNGTIDGVGPRDQMVARLTAVAGRSVTDTTRAAPLSDPTRTPPPADASRGGA